MKKARIEKDKYVIIKRNGKTKFVKKANKNMLVESPDADEISEKAEKDLTKEEKDKLPKDEKAKLDEKLKIK